ncbi:hypothetical protein QWY81_17755 [Polaribacter undariae]|uniref:Uncharacterized protein n=1 Tax=Polaribacter sejongensis TaxID=985043 RepID=A0AAJ1R1K1_9FLAO|nr:hypothetical protein [Polaribacter undariae]MDN3621317.1 hypothetical protein [Polaribacter undariae]UWD31859.1 hypothetical protein NQP51_17220 [Polaribacter undariae]
MAYTFKELSPDTYQVEDHTIIKDGNGNWISNPPIEKPSLQRAFLNYTKNL